MYIDDIHTHHADAPVTAITSVSPEDFVPREGRFYSVGMHPWYISVDYRNRYCLLDELVKHPQVVAIGETGLDRLRAEIDMKEQIFVFEHHIELSESVKKPLVIHAVRSFDQILLVYKVWRPSQPWIIHSFRGNPRLAEQLLDHGFYLSFGEYYHPESLALTPCHRLLIETDESEVPVAELYRRAADLRSIAVGEMYRTVVANTSRLFSLSTSRKEE
ncbi:TatD family hydrolase [Coprobacter tertius]|uniref:TatD family hydrolase n=1 Tax=Coprobacter tertius TaxID=2944915 RepID=A0ABT1MIJ2_9BACT|nr:TatD family hydrolase [Coprobacter tertius]MCP9612448.1 TatD family hydrolase [Coprobacter tertius]